MKHGVDILYIQLINSEIDASNEVRLGIVTKYNLEDTTIGLEIMDASKKIALPALVEPNVA